MEEGEEVEDGPVKAEWADEEVVRNKDEKGIEVKKKYKENQTEMRSLECWTCTALLGEGDRLDYTRVHHPELWVQLRPRLLGVYQVMREAAPVSV